MKRMLALSLLLTAAAAIAQQPPQVYSRSLPRGGNSLLVALKVRGALRNATYNVTSKITPFAVVVAPSTMRTDSAGYGLLNFTVRGSARNSPPQRVSVTLKSGNSTIVETMTLRSINGELVSAWPQILMIEGAFCNPVNSASTQLLISRAIDLDGDGLYGDTIVENTPRDRLDFPAEFTMDINTTGSAACNGGNAAGVFWPGTPKYQVAFCADNRQIGGPCNFTSVMNFVQDASFGLNLAGKGPALLFTSSGADRVYVGRDGNGDGRITATEIAVYFDPKSVVGNQNYSPDGVAVDPSNDKRTYWISDTSAPRWGLWQLTDANADDKIASTEIKGTWTNATTPKVVVEQQTITPKEFECVHAGADGAVYVNDTSLGTIFRWKDANGDGAATSNEVSNWLTYDRNSKMTVSADFKTAKFPPYAGPYFAMNLIESAAITTGEVFFVAVTSSSGLGAGFVFRCEDKNKNGTVNDLGEVTVLNDGGAAIKDPNPPDWSAGMDVAAVDVNGDSKLTADELFVYISNPNGPKPGCGFQGFSDTQVWVLNDQNGDGDAHDTGEHYRAMIHPTGAFVRGLELVPAGSFKGSRYNRSGMVSTAGASCMRNGRFVELDYICDKVEEGCQGTPFSGNPRFEIVVRGLGSGTPVALAVAGARFQSPFPILNCNVWVAPPFGFTGLFTANAAGEARLKIAIPATLTGTAYVQALVTSGGFATGELAEIIVR